MFILLLNCEINILVNFGKHFFPKIHYSFCYYFIFMKILSLYSEIVSLKIFEPNRKYSQISHVCIPWPKNQYFAPNMQEYTCSDSGWNVTCMVTGFQCSSVEGGGKKKTRIKEKFRATAMLFLHSTKYYPKRSLTFPKYLFAYVKSRKYVRCN